MNSMPYFFVLFYKVPFFIVFVTLYDAALGATHSSLKEKATNSRPIFFLTPLGGVIKKNQGRNIHY